ncbi:hypothetical protein SAMN05444000_13810 [Shimia gijangensis]|uniref:Uncharacterized protein n=1 Tax=Shimia gijangensis TaxID=1470563 RepID=A0A1M6TDA1_9RHOB|nr:hypothetical protein [Shimia gijangensis]SHK54975.1 hypothetical protein SAMN05444000_13810 [Shimia gijangensis]
MSGFSGYDAPSGPSALDYWKLTDELSVVDAAILITGNDPAQHYWDDDNNKIQETNHVGFEPAFKALRSAILSNGLRANIKLSARFPFDTYRGGYDTPPSDTYDDFTTSNEQGFKYTELMSRDPSYGTIKANFSLAAFEAGETVYICTEPNWRETTILTSDLKDWLRERNFFPAFFFGTGIQEGFRDKGNPRYAPKLAACVAAWEAVSQPARNRSVKQTLLDWLRSNAANFGVADGDGIVSEAVADELAKVVNWNPKGGATPTNPSSDEPNSRLPKPSPNNYPNSLNLEDAGDGLDSEIPF